MQFLRNVKFDPTYDKKVVDRVQETLDRVQSGESVECVMLHNGYGNDVKVINAANFENFGNCVDEWPRDFQLCLGDYFTILSKTDFLNAKKSTDEIDNQNLAEFYDNVTQKGWAVISVKWAGITYYGVTENWMGMFPVTEKLINNKAYVKPFTNTPIKLTSEHHRTSAAFSSKMWNVDLTNCEANFGTGEIYRFPKDSLHDLAIPVINHEMADKLFSEEKIPNSNILIPYEEAYRNVVELTLGSPFQWGGNGGGYDASGYVQKIAEAFGFEIPRNSGEIAKFCTTLTDRCDLVSSPNKMLSELQIGAVLIYGNLEKYLSDYTNIKGVSCLALVLETAPNPLAVVCNRGCVRVSPIDYDGHLIMMDSVELLRIGDFGLARAIRNFSK